MDPIALRTALGLAATATDAEVMAKLAEQTTRLAAAEAATAAATTAAATAAEVARKGKMAALVAAALADGRLDTVHGADGKTRVPSELESRIIALADAGQNDSAELLLSALPRRHPNAAGVQSTTTVPPALPAARAAVVDDNPHLRLSLAQCGLDAKDVEAYGPQNRAGLDRNKVPVPPHLAKLFATRQPKFTRPE